MTDAVVIVSCSAPIGIGGLGRGLLQAADSVRAGGEPYRVFAGGPGTGAHRDALEVITPWLPSRLAPLPPVRFMPGLQQYLVFDCFDRALAGQLDERPASVVAFSGQALHTFTRARALGCSRLALVSPTAHLSHVWRQHRLARSHYAIEGDWLNRRHLEKGLREYAMADVIYVPSAYARKTFEDEGVPASRLCLAPFEADARFTRRPSDPPGATDLFRVVYTGTLSVVKGVPLLIEAFRALPAPNAELVLVGHTGTRGMRRFVEAACAADRRIRLAPGDPLPHLRHASVYVHPSYQDGFAYAVAEALACGVPVIVSEDTGAQELVDAGVNGEIVPTGQLEPLRAALARHFAKSSNRQLVQS